MLIHGSCHCQNLAFALTWAPDPAEIVGRACGCSFCTKHGGVWTANPAASLVIAVADPAQVARYEQGTRTAQFHVCTRCGVAPLVTSRIDDRVYAVVSVNAFDDVAPSLVRRVPVSFADETGDARLARRKLSWIGDVSYRA